MTKDKAFEQINKIIGKQLIHANYEKTQKVKRFCKMIKTGEGQDEVVKSLRLSEDEALKEQRARLYQTATKVALSPVVREYKKLETVDGQKLVLELQNKDKEEQILNILESFHGSKTAKEHTFSRLIFYTFYDPNAMFLVRPKYNVQTGKPTTVESIYPVEIDSTSKIYWEKFAGDYQYVVTRSTRIEKVEILRGINKTTKDIQVFDYTYYSTGLEVECFDITEKFPDFLIDKIYEEVEIKHEVEGEKEEIKKFAFITYETKNTTFPLQDFGFMLDDETNGETFVSPINECKELFYDLIRDKSLADTTVMLHAFPQEIRVGEICNHEITTDNGIESCHKGYINGHACPKCNSSGLLKHRSEQQTAYVTAGLLSEYSLKLQDLAYYHLLPEWFLPKLEERIQSHKEAIYRTIFNAEIPKTQFNGQKTATEIDTQSIEQYKARKEFSGKHAELMTFVLEMSAQYFDAFDEKSKAFYTYPSQLEIKSLPQLYAELQTALTSKAPFEVLDSIYTKIINAQNIENPFEAKRLLLRLKFKPFISLNSDQLAMVLAERDTADKDRVLSENHSQIFDVIENDPTYPQFVLQPYQLQRERVYSEVDKFIGSIKFAASTVENTAFDGLFNQGNNNSDSEQDSE